MGIVNIWGLFSAFGGPNGLFLGLGSGSKTFLGLVMFLNNFLEWVSKMFLGSICIAKQLILFMLPSILNFYFGCILRLILRFGYPMGCFWVQVRFNTLFFGSIHIDKQLLLYMLPSIFTFDIYLIFGSFFAVWGLNGLILRLGWHSKTFLGSFCIAGQLLFSILP